jgi:hypothetical protein
MERVPLTIRQPVAAVGRRVMTRGKGAEGLRQPLALSPGYDTFGLPHASLPVPLLPPEPTNGTGSTTRGRPRTPALAAGLTDQVGTLREVRLFRVPPWPQPAGLCANRGGGKQPRAVAGAGEVRPPGRLRGRHQG